MSARFRYNVYYYLLEDSSAIPIDEAEMYSA